MRNTLRLGVVGVLMGASAVLGTSTAVAQEACEYPFDCPEVIDGETTDGAVADPSPAPGGTSTGGTTDVDAGGTTATGGGAGSGSQLPLTGGEAMLLGVTGLGALAGGTALVVAGRRRVADA